MSFSYDPTQLSDNLLYQVRFRLGDTNESNATFQDEEISYSLDCNNQAVIETCIDCVSALLPRLARGAKFKVGPYSEEESGASYDFWVKMLEIGRAPV